MAFWQRRELPWPLRATPGALPGDDASEIAGIKLPPGRPRIPDDDFAVEKGTPALWTSDAIIRGGPSVWLRLAAAFGSTGLWPLLLESASHDPERPWLSGEFEGAASGENTRDPATILSEWWPEEDGPTFPGLARPTPGELDRSAPARVLRHLRKTRLGLVPASRPADVTSSIGFMGTLNYDLEMSDVARVLESWEDRFGAIVVGLGFDTMTFVVCRPPRSLAEALPIAAEHYAMCSDLVDQGAGTLEAYARIIVKSEMWMFWWD